MADHESKVSLKLLIDKTRNKVLFAEAGKDFVDFLFNLMSMPLGTVTRLLTKNSMVGSLGNLYGSIENLNEAYLQTKETKDSLLKPKLPSSASDVRLLLPTHDTLNVSKNMYQCQNSYSKGYYQSCVIYVSESPQTLCPGCKTIMNRLLLTCVNPASATATSSKGGGFIKGLVTFMVTNDLVVTPMATISSITSLINKFGVKGINKVEERVVHLGMDQGLMVLKESLQSDTVLSRVFLEQPLSEIKTVLVAPRKSEHSCATMYVWNMQNILCSLLEDFDLMFGFGQVLSVNFLL